MGFGSYRPAGATGGPTPFNLASATERVQRAASSWAALIRDCQAAVM